MKKMRSKKSQITIFIIIAIVIIAVVLLFFRVKLKTTIQEFFITSYPDMMFSDCINSKIKEAVALVSKRGGSIAPSNAFMFKDEKIEYLCYTNQYYKTCVMQQPLLKQHIERELFDYIEKDAKACLSKIKSDLESKGYAVSSEKQALVLEILPKNIKLVSSGISIIKADKGERYDKLVAVHRTKIYELIMLATSILNFEARYGDSDITIYMLYYPNIKVEKYKQSEGSKIYILTDTNSKDKFTFATRSLSWPPGYGFNEVFG